MILTIPLKCSVQYTLPLGRLHWKMGKSMVLKRKKVVCRVESVSLCCQFGVFKSDYLKIRGKKEHKLKRENGNSTNATTPNRNRNCNNKMKMFFKKKYGDRKDGETMAHSSFFHSSIMNTSAVACISCLFLLLWIG